ncbi:MAG: recombinase family protein [Candidatus Accumulibacter sp.]|uniref:Recombinase family protein n=1 Tax=Candidatus Accumulibacter proximus TaxID=2954385 RepID=A0A935Q4L2_9PROT|nr:recombinase family protein [Candidatus Accumulibacter proximus]
MRRAPVEDQGLARSLSDFSRLIEVFERNKVSFVAVTQQFNTTTSMSRLMLNALLSFAQFEREVTAERIRDQIAASKTKGMWMGGSLPLGYDVENRLLVVNEAEAGLARRILKDSTRCRSATEMVRELAADGHTTKSRRCLTKQTLYKMMHNRIYRGEILRKGTYYAGQHPAINDQGLWDAVRSSGRTTGSGPWRHASADSRRRCSWAFSSPTTGNASRPPLPARPMARCIATICRSARLA